MNNHRKKAELLMKIGNDRIAEKNRKTLIIKRTAFSVSGICAAVAVGFGIWNNNDIKNASDFNNFNSSDIIIEDYSEASETTVSASLTITYSVTSANTKKSSETEMINSASVTQPNTTEYATESQTAVSVQNTEIPLQTDNPVIITSVPITDIHSETTTTDSISNPVENVNPPDSSRICMINDFNGLSYTSREKIIVPKENTGSFLGKAEVESDFVEENNSFENRFYKKAYIYSVRDFSEKYVTAVRYEDEEIFYLYENKSYFPDNLDTLITECSLENHLFFKSAEYYDKDNFIVCCGFSDNLIWDFLMNYRNTAPCSTDNFPSLNNVRELTLICEMPEIYDNTINFVLSNDGLLRINLDENEIAFNIGEQKANDFMDLLITNYSHQTIR